MPSLLSRLALISIAFMSANVTLAQQPSQPNSGIVRFPTIHDKAIAFVYAGDVWSVHRSGGDATRLTNSPGPKNNTRFSPDGKTIAFTGTHNGLYTIPAEGGAAARITHNPGTTTLCSWTPDGRLLFMSDAFSHIFDGDGQARVRQLFTVAASGGLPQKLPVPYGANGVISDDGEWLAYTPYAEGLSEKRKRYYGGFAPDVWLFNLKNHQARQITDWKGADTSPMWRGAIIYYLSDAGAEARMNIWSYDTRARTRRQVTHFSDFDVKWPSIGPGEHGQGEIVSITEQIFTYWIWPMTSREKSMSFFRRIWPPHAKPLMQAISSSTGTFRPLPTEPSSRRGAISGRSLRTARSKE